MSIQRKQSSILFYSNDTNIPLHNYKKKSRLRIADQLLSLSPWWFLHEKFNPKSTCLVNMLYFRLAAQTIGNEVKNKSENRCFSATACVWSPRRRRSASVSTETGDMAVVNYFVYSILFRFSFILVLSVSVSFATLGGLLKQKRIQMF